MIRRNRNDRPQETRPRCGEPNTESRQPPEGRAQPPESAIPVRSPGPGRTSASCGRTSGQSTAPRLACGFPPAERSLSRGRPSSVQRVLKDALPLRDERRAPDRARWPSVTNARRHGERCRRAIGTGRRPRVLGGEERRPFVSSEIFERVICDAHVRAAASFRAS